MYSAYALKVVGMLLAGPLGVALDGCVGDVVGDLFGTL